MPDILWRKEYNINIKVTIYKVFIDINSAKIEKLFTCALYCVLDIKQRKRFVPERFVLRANV